MTIDWLGLALRLMHILAALTAAGGSIFIWLALLPAVKDLPDGIRQDFHAKVRKRWAPMVGACILFLLVSGLVNFILINRNILKGYDVSLYHALFGVKFLLALAVFFIASALAGRSPSTQSMRDNASFWAGLNVLFLVVIVTASSIMRGTHIAANPDLPRKSEAPVPVEGVK